MRVELVGADGHVDVEASVGTHLHRFSHQVGAQVVVLLQGEGHRTFVGVEHHERRCVVVELVPVVQVRHEAQRDGQGQRQPRRQAAHPERQVVGDDDELSGRFAAFPGRPQVGALHRGVGQGARRRAARHVGELRSGVVPMPVQFRGAGVFDALAAAGHQVAVGDVVAVEVDGALMPRGQVEARRVSAGQRPVVLVSGPGRRVRRKVLREAGVLREVPVRGEARRPGAEQREPGEQARAARTQGCGHRDPPGRVCGP